MKINEINFCFFTRNVINLIVMECVVCQSKIILVDGQVLQPTIVSSIKKGENPEYCEVQPILVCSINCQQIWLKRAQNNATHIVKISCRSCGKFSEGQLHKCSGCKIVYYCNVVCQRNDWQNHKEDCKK